VTLGVKSEKSHWIASPAARKDAPLYNEFQSPQKSCTKNFFLNLFLSDIDLIGCLGTAFIP
jgi:hypothetical protein